jgi:hypothetical protein
VSYEVHDTSTFDRQVDGIHVEDAYDDEGMLAPNYDEHSTSHPTHDTHDDDEGMMVPTYDRGGVFERSPGDMDPSSQESCVEDDVMHESHHSMVSPSASSDDDEESTLTDDGPDHLDVVGQRPLALRDLEDRLLVTEDRITQVLTRTDGARRFIEDFMRRAQIEERHSGVAGGVTSAHLRIDKEALEQLKSDYLQLFMDRDLALKFVEDKAGEVEELRYQLSLVRSSPLT